jgi:SRSO17 transposase
MKEVLDLGRFEGRGWRSWHHHVTLVMLAYVFLRHEQQPNIERNPDSADKFFWRLFT